MNVKRRRGTAKDNRKSLEITCFIGLLAIEGWRQRKSNHERSGENERIRGSLHGRDYVIGADLGNAESRLEICRQRGVNMMGKDFEITRVEIFLHEFNRSAIEQFLKANGFEVVGESWERKIKLVLLVIDEVQQGYRK